MRPFSPLPPGKRAGGQLPALDQHHVGPPLPGEVVEGAGPDDAAADDHDTGMGLHDAISWWCRDGGTVTRLGFVCPPRARCPVPCPSFGPVPPVWCRGSSAGLIQPDTFNPGQEADAGPDRAGHPPGSSNCMPVSAAAPESAFARRQGARLRWLDCRLGVGSDFAGERYTDRRRWQEREAMGMESLRAAVVADPRGRGGPREPNGTSRSGALDATTPC